VVEGGVDNDDSYLLVVEIYHLMIHYLKMSVVQILIHCLGGVCNNTVPVFLNTSKCYKVGKNNNNHNSCACYHDFCHNDNDHSDDGGV